MEPSKVRAGQIRQYIRDEFLSVLEPGYIMPSSHIMAKVLGCSNKAALTHIRVALGDAGVEVANRGGRYCGLIVTKVNGRPQ